jgi:protein pelota
MNLTESTGGKVTVVSSEHEGGKQLKALGGMAALLRYSLG